MKSQAFMRAERRGSERMKRDTFLRALPRLHEWCPLRWWHNDTEQLRDCPWKGHRLLFNLGEAFRQPVELKRPRK